jgi:hypothetical protein
VGRNDVAQHETRGTEGKAGDIGIDETPSRPKIAAAMRVFNVHHRDFPRAPAAVGELIDTLASDNDRLWPGDDWPPMRFPGGLRVGAEGGHGPIRYRVEVQEPGRSVRFRFLAPAGFEGFHEFRVTEATPGSARLEHRIEMQLTGAAVLQWTLMIRALNDALLEDSLNRAAIALGCAIEARPWSAWVRVVRWFLRRRGAKQG